MKCDHMCNECGEREQGNWNEAHATKLADESLCTHCAFWLEKVAGATAADVVRVDGSHYRIADEKRAGMRGFSGQSFTIKFRDGREVTTTNLWCQGAIPMRFRDRLPDNAEFL